jgi:hypothetical protein
LVFWVLGTGFRVLGFKGLRDAFTARFAQDARTQRENK